MGHNTIGVFGTARIPLEDFGRKSGRFNAEYGFQSFPQLSSLSQLTKETDLNLDSKVMKHHQKSYVGNEMMTKQAKRLFNEPADFNEMIFQSQLTQAKAVGIAVAAHRVKAPVCMGTLFWQLNDCWPAPTWSSLLITTEIGSCFNTK